MADTKVLSEEVAAKIGGGDCTVQDAITLTGQLTAAYENLIEFTTYMMERVAGQ